ncbi:BTAD domain-containing putative transcriptional regulator [Frankia sp. AiPa1]|uniref:BTAD domain-containing putative transcriptional regulator n=1 Tax=Frankia sp. AiPa1 TaxID=573492 RepID=UPI00202B987C|nr:BTAD domain-containing putative transcriptional regulator [Frankia sp. AiPa1]MCL9757976.1 tetratricopeptide repeat protein [Frankia sp. AiPa1]
MPERDSLQFAILGPLEVTAAGVPLVLGGTQRKVLLTVLLLEVGQTVPIYRLLEAIWRDMPPDRAKATLRTHISELRRRIESGPEPRVLQRRGEGYLLDVHPEQIDAHRARRLLAQGRRAMEDGDPVSAIAPLQEAQSLWRGPSLADVADHPFAHSYVTALTELQLDVTKTRLAADLALGRHREVLGELKMQVDRHPTDDGLRHELVLALYREGRVDEANRACREGLAARHELGLESPMLRRLQEDVLRAAPSLAWTPPRSLERRTTVTPPTGSGHSLPPDVEEYTGRDTLQARTLALLTDEAALARGTVATAFAGKAGTGKTALAVRIAHQVRAAFTDVLYVDLRGTRGPLEPTRVLTRFVQALGVSRAAVPADPDDLHEMYLQLLSTRRALIILDNAANEAQLRPLMPSSPGCAVLVTSRTRLQGLAMPCWVVDVLIPDDAVELLEKVVGAARVGAEEKAARDIVGLCGYLPLAIQIAGRKLAAHPHWRLSRIVTRLGVERDRLTWLELGDLEIRASFRLSYDGRRPDEQRAFRLLSLPAVNDFTAWAAAAVLAVEVDEAEDVLDRLADAQLLERRGLDPTGTERYGLHELLRVFAREQETGPADDSHSQRSADWPDERTGDRPESGVAADVAERGSRVAAAVTDRPGTLPVMLSTEHAAALGRLLYAYLVMLRAAVDTFSPGAARAALPAGDAPALFAERGAARIGGAALAELTRQPLGWFAAERSNLLALMEQAYAGGLDQPTWLLAAEATDFYLFGAHWADWARSHELGLAAARRGGHRRAEAELLTNLGEREITLAFEEAFWRLDAAGGDPGAEPAVAVDRGAADRLALAMERFSRAREILAGLGDDLGEARAVRGLGSVCRGRGDRARAVEHFEAGLSTMRRTGARRAEAETLVSLAMAHGDRGELADAITCLTMSLSIARELASRPLRAQAQRRLGDLYRHQHRPDQALTAYNESLPMLADLPDPVWEPRVLVRRGDILAELGDQPAARRSWQQGVTLLRERGSTELAAAERRLSAPLTTEATQFTGGRLLGAFDPAEFTARVASSRRSVRLLNTWTDLALPPHRDAFADALLLAVEAGAIVQVLLLDPDAPAAATRAADLAHRVDVSALIRANLLALAELRARLDPVGRARLGVRLYAEQPLASYHRWDTGALVSSFPIGVSSAATTQHEATISSTLVQFVEQHFDRLWTPPGSMALDDYLRVPLRVSPADADVREVREVRCAYVRMDGVAYLHCADLHDLLRGGPDGLVATLPAAGAHPLGGTGRWRVVPLRGESGARPAERAGADPHLGTGRETAEAEGVEAVATAFARKYGTAFDGVVRLTSMGG